MTVLAVNLSRYELDIINSVDSYEGQDIIASRLLGCIASYMCINPYTQDDDNWPRVKQVITLLETASSCKGRLVEGLAKILSVVKKNIGAHPLELGFLFALGLYYADKLDQYEELPQDEQDLLLDFFDCHRRWTENKDPFLPSRVETIDWNIPSLMETWSCLHYFPARWAVSDYLRHLSLSLYHLLDSNGAVSAFFAKQHVEIEDINLLRQQIGQALQSHLPSCFSEVQDHLLFSFTNPSVHELYTRLYLLATVQTSSSEEDLMLCRQYLSRLSPKSLDQFEINLCKGLLVKYSLEEADLLRPFSAELTAYIVDRSEDEGCVFWVKALREVLCLENALWHKEIQAVLPPFLYTLVDDTSLAMLANPRETIEALNSDDLSAVDTVAHSVERVFTRCLALPSMPFAAYFYHQMDAPKIDVSLQQADDNYIVLPGEKKLDYKEFCASPYFEKLQCKEDIFASLESLAYSSNFRFEFFQFIENLKQPSWYLMCADDPVKNAHLATIALYTGEISEEAFFVIHRVCEAHRDSSISAQFTVLDRSNVEAFLEERNYPPYAYRKSFARQKDFASFLSSLSSRSIVERTCIEYRLEHYSLKNIERFVSEKAEYKEGCRFVQQEGDLSVFYTLLPPFLNIELYNSLVGDDYKRSSQDYVWGFGFSEDPSPFFQGKRPVSIASVYHTLEDLSSFTIHGFAQPDAKSLGLDFHDSTYHIPIEMNLNKEELAFLGFAAESMHHFSQKLFEVCADPIQKKRYQDMFSLYVEAMIDREIFVSAGGGRLLAKRVDVKEMSQNIHRHPLIKNLQQKLPVCDRLALDISSMPRKFYTDTSRYLARCVADLSEDRPPVVTLTFGLKASK